VVTSRRRYVSRQCRGIRTENGNGTPPHSIRDDSAGRDLATGWLQSSPAVPKQWWMFPNSLVLGPCRGRPQSHFGADPQAWDSCRLCAARWLSGAPAAAKALNFIRLHLPHDAPICYPAIPKSPRPGPPCQVLDPGTQPCGPNSPKTKGRSCGAVLPVCWELYGAQTSILLCPCRLR